MWAVRERSLRVNRATAHTAAATIVTHTASIISIPTAPAAFQSLPYQPIIVGTFLLRRHNCAPVWPCSALRVWSAAMSDQDFVKACPPVDGRTSGRDEILIEGYENLYDC